jgi:endonuclease YncB( thermonuclease family)
MSPPRRLLQARWTAAAAGMVAACPGHRDRHELAMRPLLPLLAICALSAGDAWPVQSVGDDGRIQILLRGIPVSLTLAHVEWPEDPAARAAAVARLRQLATGTAEVGYDPAYGTDQGAGRVVMKVKAGDLGEQLAGSGLVRIQPGTTTTARLAAMAQERAKRAKTGLWAETAPAPVVAAARPPAPVAAAAAAPASTGAEVVSELGTAYFYPPGHRAVASVNPQRLIRYRDEASARKAGKQPAPEEVALPSGSDRKAADATFEAGRAIMAKAMDMGASPERDRLYAQAFPVLARAVELYNQLAERAPDDAALLEQLRVANQMRHAAMKYRRS